MKTSEMNFKINFLGKYFKSNTRLDVAYDINQVDAVIFNKISEKPLLYIEAKKKILNENDLQKAIAQAVLTNKKQKHILDVVCIVYQNKEEDILISIDCSGNSVMFNNDINWDKERPSQPSIDAIERINDRIKDRTIFYKNKEIKEFFKKIFLEEKNKINLSHKNFIGVFNEWKNTIKFNPKIKDEQKLINLFIVDLLNKRDFKMKDDNQLMDISLTFEGTELDKYTTTDVLNTIGFIYLGKKRNNNIWIIENLNDYKNIWKKFNRPSEEVFKYILEHSAKLYTKEYRRITGAEYTPVNLVELQNKRLKDLGYNLNEYIVFDPCAGVGNLENQFGQDYKEFCFLSTLEQTDVDVCKGKDFNTAIQYDFLKDNEFPKFKHEGQLKDIRQIAKDLGRKLMIVMNPPFQQKKGFKNNLAVEFFKKCLKLEPEVIVFYYTLEGIFKRKWTPFFVESNYKINSHIIVNAKKTFGRGVWPISQIIFDKNQGEAINLEQIAADRYEVNKKTSKLEFVQTYNYDFKNKYLIKEIEKEIKRNASGLKLGRWSYLRSYLFLGNNEKETKDIITTQNLKFSLMGKGINFNGNDKYFERNSYVFRGTTDKISEELFNDSIMFSLFCPSNAFSNKNGLTNYIMPFTHQELGCSKSDLNVLRGTNEDDLFNSQNEEVFDFREFMKQFSFSEEAMNLYKAALEIFRYYHKNYKDTNFNDSFYDVTNTIMKKDPTKIKKLEVEIDPRICKSKIAKGTLSFRRRNLNKVIPVEDLKIFYDFFETRDILAVKINKQLLNAGLLLWERENLY